MAKYLVEDNSGSLESKTLNEKELIAYANDAHWVEKDLTKPIDDTWQVYACDNVRDAIEILKTDNLWVTELPDLDKYLSCMLYYICKQSIPYMTGK